jgi:hypothetical protein
MFPSVDLLGSLTLGTLSLGTCLSWHVLDGRVFEVGDWEGGDPFP